MKSLAKLTKGVIIVAMTTLIGSAPVLARTFVYVATSGCTVCRQMAL